MAGVWPWCYDNWWWADYPPPYRDYGPDYQFSPPPPTSNLALPNRAPDFTLGYAWGIDLRTGLVKLDQVIVAVKLLWPNAPAEAHDQFRAGFIAGYGQYGDATFESALKAAGVLPASEPSQQPR